MQTSPFVAFQWQILYRANVEDRCPTEWLVTHNSGKRDFRPVAEVTDTPDTNAAVVEPEPLKSSDFSVNERFGFLETITQLLIDKKAYAALFTGGAGCGKTTTCLEKIIDNGIVDITLTETDGSEDDVLADPDKESDCSKVECELVRKDMTFIHKQGYSTAKYLYRTLHENNGSIIVLDDCDSVFRDKEGIAILKAALDSKEKRIVSWGAEASVDERGKLPRTFEFTGRIVFISNLSRNKIDSAVISRCKGRTLDFTLTVDEILERMETVILRKTFMPHYSMKHKRMALDFMYAIKNDIQDMCMRALEAVVVNCATLDNWQEISRHTLCE
jgi:hypothetical protein